MSANAISRVWFAVFFLASLYCRLASASPATSLSSETSFGQDTFMQSITGDGSFAEKSPWKWTVGYQLTNTKYDPPGSPEITDKTNEFSVGSSYSERLGWGGSLEAQYSSTPQENLTSFASQVGASYKFLVADAKEGFTPSLKLRTKVGTRSYNETFTTTSKSKRGVVRVSGKSNDLRQNSLSLGARWAFHPSWRLDAAASRYWYDRDVGQFQSYLDSPLAIRQGISGLSGTVGGLPQSTFELGIEVDLIEQLTLSLTETQSVIAADNSQSRSTEVKLDYEWNDAFATSIGASFVSSTETTETLGLVGLDFNF